MGYIVQQYHMQAYIHKVLGGGGGGVSPSVKPIGLSLNRGYTCRPMQIFFVNKYLK